MHKLKEYVCEQLEELERKVAKEGKLSMNELQYGDLLQHFKKSMLQTEELENKGGEYGMRGGYYRGDSYADDGYADGNYVRPDGSYRREIVDSSYSRGRGRNARRDSMGRYAGPSDQTIQEVRMLLNRTDDEHARKELSKLIDRLESM